MTDTGVGLGIGDEHAKCDGLTPSHWDPHAASSIGSVLMHAHNGRIDHRIGIMICGQRVHKLVPYASPALANETIVAGGVWSKLLRQIAPWCAGPQYPKDAVEHAPVIHPRNAARYCPAGTA